MEKLPRENAEKLMRELEKDISYHSRLYYIYDKPEISDFEYDRMFRRLQELEEEYPELKNPNSPTLRVGGDPLSAFESVEHTVPMGSLTDVFSYEELDAFIKKAEAAVGKDAYFSAEPKIDGLSVALTYEKGRFVRGATRGNGTVGEDVTENLRTVGGIPLMLSEPLDITVRGEVYMSRASFEGQNRRRAEKGEALMANSRNAAAGSLRQLDSKVTASRGLDIFVFNLQAGSLYADGHTEDSHTAILDRLEALGFTVLRRRERIKGADNVRRYVAELGEARTELEYDTDGAVIKLDSLELRRRMGEGTTTPNWAVAFKYPPEEKEATLLDIVIQVGRTGVLTPNAVLTPVRLAGTTVSRATLHNADFIAERDIRIGDTVIVRKAGEIIPEIVKSLPEKRQGAERPYLMPDTCPSCGEPTVRDEEAAVRCKNPDCPAQRARQIEHFATKAAMDIEGLGPRVVELLLSEGRIKDAADLYSLRPEDVSDLPGMGEKSAVKLCDAIERSKGAGLEKLLYALGIRQVGEVAAAAVAKKAGELFRMFEITREELCEIGDIGEITADNIVTYFSTAHARERAERFRDAGLLLTAKEKPVGDALAGKIIVITGTLPTMSRDEAKKLITAHGGKASSSVSKKTDYLLCGADAGSKLAEAQRLGTTIITEEELREMLGL
ncbi:MAG: NAD-dependent DNA ligase LigA [Clostridia bacterium]|nr:NAD-dependent DNA ligase LigA [Clostridia bacterium]